MIKFALHPPHAGWVHVELEGKGVSFGVTGSYLSDCLRDLVDTIQSLATAKSATCTWEQEPGVIIWSLGVKGDEVELTLTDGQSQILFREAEEWARFGVRVLAAFDKLLAETGAERYESDWHHPFPVEAVRKLRNALHR